MTPLEDELVYHYTNFEAFLNIVKSRSLWASDLEAVNDPTELYHARGLLQGVFSVHGERSAAVGNAIRQAFRLEYLPSRWNFAGESQFQYQRFSEGAIEYLKQYTAESHWGSAVGHVFGISFCKKPDLLSQWRAYGLSGGGVCVGFDRQELKTCFQEGSEIVDVNYNQKMQIHNVLNFMRPAFERYQAEMKQLDPSDSLFAQPEATVCTDAQGRLELDIENEQRRPFHENKIIQECLDGTLAELGAIAHTFKLNAFSEEQEVRLIFKLPANGPELENIKLRARGDVLIPYIEMVPITGVLPIRRVIIGPASKSFDQSYALKILLAKFGHVDVQIEPSRFELR